MQPKPDERTSFPGVNVAESLAGVRKSHIEIPVRDGVNISAVLYQPESISEAGVPLVVFYHGGGWCLGAPEQEEVHW
jgi:acetyl esterase/lipase